MENIPKLLDFDMGKLPPPKEFSTMGCGTLKFVKNHSHADLDRVKEYWLGIRKTTKPLKGPFIRSAPTLEQRRNILLARAGEPTRTIVNDETMGTTKTDVKATAKIKMTVYFKK